MNRLSKRLAISLCLVASVLSWTAPVRAASVAAMLQMNAPSVGRQLDAGVPSVVHVAGPAEAVRAAEGFAQGRAVNVQKKGNKFIVTVVAGGSAVRCLVDADSGRVLGCN